MTFWTQVRRHTLFRGLHGPGQSTNRSACLGEVIFLSREEPLSVKLEKGWLVRCVFLEEEGRVSERSSVYLGADRGDVNEHAHLSDACAPDAGGVEKLTAYNEVQGWLARNEAWKACGRSFQSNRLVRRASALLSNSRTHHTHARQRIGRARNLRGRVALSAALPAPCLLFRNATRSSRKRSAVVSSWLHAFFPSLLSIFLALFKSFYWPIRCLIAAFSSGFPFSPRLNVEFLINRFAGTERRADNFSAMSLVHICNVRIYACKT